MNNAGIMLYKNLKARAADLAGLTAEVNINVGGVIGMTSAFIDILTANKGTVINVSSALAFYRCHPHQSTAPPRRRSTPTRSHYGSNWEETGVEVIELLPPAVKTDLAADIAEGRRYHSDDDGGVGEAILCVPQYGCARNSARAGQAARVHAPPRPGFHQQAALEGV